MVAQFVPKDRSQNKEARILDNLEHLPDVTLRDLYYMILASRKSSRKHYGMKRIESNI